MGGALEARGIPASGGRLVSEARGEVEKDGKVLLLKRIHVTYHLKVDSDKLEAAKRAHQFHASSCPVARSIGDCVEITTSLQMEEV